MVRIGDVAMIALCASVAAVGLFSSPPHHMGTMTPAEAVQELLPLTAMVALLTAVLSIYAKLHQHARAVAVAVGASTEVAAAVASAAVGLLQYLLHDDDGTRPRAVGAAAALVLPAAATATFFLGMVLVYAHGSGAAPGAGDGPVQTPVWILILTKLTFGAAAGVIALMAVALYG